MTSRTQQVITHKRTGSFGYGGLKVLPAGNWGASCKARDPNGVLVQVFDVGFTLDGTYVPPVDQPTLTRYVITIRASAAQAKLWPLVLLKSDVAFFDDSTPEIVVPTDTFVISVIEGQTDVV